MQCLLVGNYGVGNLGDDALREYFLQTYPEVTWQVVSQNPRQGELARLPGGVRSLFSGRWISTLQAYRRCDAVVFGGGSLFTDVESVYACFLWGLHVAVARLFGKPVVLAFQGIGPFRTRTGAWLARFSVRASRSISVRDSLSFERVAAWIPSRKIVQSSDPVFSLIKNKKIDRNTKNVFIIIPRHNSDATFRFLVQNLLRDHQFAHVHVIAMQHTSLQEKTVISQLLDVLPVGAEVAQAETLDALLEEISGASFVVTQRYHGAIAALALEVPVRIIPQGDGDKLSTLAGADARSLTVAVGEGEEELRRVLADISR
jgi:polysaccharide pyruvyl transferase CsaB